MFDDEAATITATLTSILSCNFPEQPPTDEVISDGDNDIPEGVVKDTGNYDQYHMMWDNYFVCGIYIDVRGVLH